MADLTSCEEADIPEKLTEKTLSLWSISKHTGFIQSDKNDFSANIKCFLLSNQHLNSLSPAIKRCRRQKIVEPDLVPKANPKLPPYLQQVETHNPELMNKTNTEVHISLPTIEVIEEEQKYELLLTNKPWEKGLVLQEGASLVDPEWEKSKETKYLDKMMKNSQEKSPSVMAGILQQWQK